MLRLHAQRFRTIPLAVVAASMALFGVGCEPPYSTVKGKVTLEGKALKGALVGFFPEKGRGSYGTTDAEGRYELMYTDAKPGVPAGKCIVRITTADANTPEKLPARYHEKSELTEEVKPGDNVFDFDLKKK
jgi:hypothetical protein